MAWAVVGGAAVTWGLNELSKPSGGGQGSASSAADPFGSQRGQYQPQLAGLVNNPGSFFSSDPLYRAEFDQGLEAVKRTQGAMGLGHSGNQLAELEKYGMSISRGAYNDRFNQLSLLSGATNGSPATSGSLIDAQNQRNTAAYSTLGSQLGKAAKNWWDQPSSGGGDTSISDSPASASDFG